LMQTTLLTGSCARRTAPSQNSTLPTRGDPKRPGYFCV
jgi:hypothetical protein